MTPRLSYGPNTALFGLTAWLALLDAVGAAVYVGRVAAVPPPPFVVEPPTVPAGSGGAPAVASIPIPATGPATATKTPPVTTTVTTTEPEPSPPPRLAVSFLTLPLSSADPVEFIVSVKGAANGTTGAIGRGKG